jgi:phage-related baseplate assembly protein
VAITAETTGTLYNVDPNTITSFGSKPSGVDTVRNPSAITNGRGLETDDAFRSRLVNQLKMLSRATPSALVNAALTATNSTTGARVLFANLIEDDINLGNVTMYVDDGAGTAEGTPVTVVDQVILASAVGGEVDLYALNKPIKIEAGYTVKLNNVAMTSGIDYTLNPASGHIKLLTTGVRPSGLVATDNIKASYAYFDDSGLLAITQKIIDGDPSDRVNYPGYRAAGVLVRVLSPTVRQMLFTANITVKHGFNQVGIAAQVSASISEYVNGLGIGDDVILSELIDRAMSVPGMFDVLILNPTSNTVISDSELARILDSNITIG